MLTFSVSLIHEVEVSLLCRLQCAGISIVYCVYAVYLCCLSRIDPLPSPAEVSALQPGQHCKMALLDYRTAFTHTAPFCLVENAPTCHSPLCLGRLQSVRCRSQITALFFQTDSGSASFQMPMSFCGILSALCLQTE